MHKGEKTGQRDKNGRQICLNDVVRKYVGREYFEGTVVFAHGACRILIKRDFSGHAVECDNILRYNYSLLFDEVAGTANVEVVEVA